MEITQIRRGCIWQLCSDEETEAKLILRKSECYKIYAIKCYLDFVPPILNTFEHCILSTVQLATGDVIVRTDI